jgi:hypothetical protein
MFFYVLLVVIVVCLFLISYKYPTTEKAISLILLGIIILIGGFRDRIGWDYYYYTNWYLKGTRDDGLEIGFFGIMQVFRYLNLDYHFLFFFFSFFTYLFAYLGIRKYTRNSSLPMVLYVLIPVLFLYSFTYVRQFLSVAIAFYAFSFLLEKKYLGYFLLMLIGISIHYSCVVSFVVFLAVFKWGYLIKSHHLFILMVLTFIIGQIGVIYWISFLLKNSHYLYYVSSTFAKKVPVLKLLAINTMGFLVIYYYDQYRFKNHNQKYLLLLYICSILFLNLFSESTELTRLYIYFRIFEIILVAEIIYTAMQNKRFWFIGFVCCFYLVPYFRAIQIDYEVGLENLKLIPYKSLLFKNNEL